MQGYTSDGRAAATLRRRGSQSGMRDADGSSDDELDVDDAMIHGVANVARLQEGWSGGHTAQLDASSSLPAPPLRPDVHPLLDVSMNSDEGLDEVTAHGSVLAPSCTVKM